MKKFFILFFIFLMPPLKCNDILPIKDERIFIQKIINTQNQSQEELFDYFSILLNDWDFKYKEAYLAPGVISSSVGTAGVPLNVQTIINSFKDSNKVSFNKNQTTLKTKLLILHVTDYLVSPQLLIIKADLRIDIKNEKYRYTLSDFVYEHYIRNNPYANGQQIPLANSKHSACSPTGSFIEILECPKRKKQIKKSFNVIKNEINEYLKILENPIFEEEW